MSYTSPTWKNGSAPALSAEILQALTDAVQEHDEALPKKADTATTASYMLPVAGWDSEAKTQTVSATGMSASANIIVVAAPESYIPYNEAGIRCTGQGTDTLTFTCEEVPTEDVTANVLVVY